MAHTSTPREISADVLRLCAQLVDNPEPVYLNVTPNHDGDINDCFQIVDRHVHQHGGSVSYGWEIWEWPLVMVEAEFHVVWKDDGGILHELTPKQLSVQRILFLPDANRDYKGRQVNNVRLPLSPKPDVAEFIEASEAEFEFMNRGSRAEQHGELILGGAEAEEYTRITKRKALAYQRILYRLGRPGRNDPCPCGSEKKYKRCHGQ